MSSYPHRLAETAPPGAEPLTLDEARAHLRVEHDADDALILGLIAAARQACEQATGRALITRGYSLWLDAWPPAGRDRWWDGMREGADTRGAMAELPLPRPPLASVTEILVYAENGTSSAFDAANYVVDTASAPGRVVLKTGALAPLPGRAANGIEIRFRAGYGPAPQNVPAALRQGMKQLVAHLYENRGDDGARALAASGALALFQPYRMVGL